MDTMQIHIAEMGLFLRVIFSPFRWHRHHTFSGRGEFLASLVSVVVCFVVEGRVASIKG